MAELTAPNAVPFGVTERAASRVQVMLQEEGRPEAMLRVYITGGGCSGFQYGFEFADATDDGDTSIEKNGVTVLVDPMSFQYLMGAELDYKEDLMGSMFVINNPNATTTCGCGASFSV